MMWGLTLAFLVIALTLWLLWRKRKFSVLKEMGIPGPEPNLIFGNLRELVNKSPLVCHKEWIQKYGKVVGYYFGMKPIIVVADLDLLKKIQVSEFHKFINRPPLLNVAASSDKSNRGPFSEQLASLKDKRWKDIRSILTPSFTTNKMRQMAPIINDALDALIGNIEEKSKSGKSFDIFPMYQGLTMDVIGRTAFGIKTDVQRNPDDPFIRTARLITTGSISNWISILTFSFPELLTVWTYLRGIRLRFLNKGKNPFFELVDEVKRVIKLRREDKSTRRLDLLQLMIDAGISESDLEKITGEQLTAGDDETEMNTNKETANGTPLKSSSKRHQMTDDEILDNSILFLLAGYGTTSATLAFTTHFLLHYPEVQEKIREEVNDLISREGKLDYSSIQELQYLDQVITESLRMYPVVFLFVNREVSEDVTYGNYHFKKGMTVQVPVYSLHHDPELWSEPEKFMPERFAPENKNKNNSLAFQAFGAGPRNCVGMRFAQMEAKLALARILHKYKLVPCEETDKEPITLRVSPASIRPQKGVYLKAVPC